MSNDKYMMELPLDADEVPIRVGDVMCGMLTGDEYKVEAVGVGCFFAWRGAVRRFVHLDAEGYVHRKPRTLEDVLGDFLDRAFAAQSMFVAESMDSDEYDSTLEELARKTAEEIRSGNWTTGY